AGTNTLLYRNRGDGTFTNELKLMQGVTTGRATWGSYDSDYSPDVFLTGSTNSTSVRPFTRMYANAQSSYPNNTLPQVYQSDAAWGDYNNDGVMDIVVSGLTLTGGVTRVFRPDPVNYFTETADILPGTYLVSLGWADYDNDGDLDLLLAGTTNGTS